MVQNLFWIVFIRQFPSQIKSIKQAEAFGTKISELYTKLQYNLPKPKANYINYLVFLHAYIVHK